MAREIKFRAWDLDCGIMRDWEWCRKCEYPFYSEAGGVDLLSKEFILMQFTGLLDKNGKEIYEGDIVRYNQWDDDYDIYEDEPTLGKICFEYGAFVFKRDDLSGFTYLGGTYQNSEVVGNIYEHPELLSHPNQSTKSMSINREQYEKDLAEKQRQHLERIKNRQNDNWRPCLHDSCPECFGTGLKWDGSMCIHMISCPCPKCTPTY